MSGRAKLMVSLLIVMLVMVMGVAYVFAAPSQQPPTQGSNVCPAYNGGAGCFTGCGSGRNTGTNVNPGITR